MKWKWWDLTCIIGRKDASLKKWQGDSSSYSKIITDKVNAAFWVARQKNRCKTKSTFKLSLGKFLCMDMHVSWSYTTLLGFPQHGFLPTLSCSFILDQIEPDYCCLYAHGCETIHWPVGNLPMDIYPLQNVTPPTTAINYQELLSWGQGNCDPLPYSCWNFNWLYLVQILYRWP